MSFTRQNSMLSMSSSFITLFLICITSRLDFCFSDVPSSLRHINGRLSFFGNEFAATDFGNLTHYQLPLAVLYPNSVSDIASTVQIIAKMGSNSGLTVAARGNGHSLHGQAQAPWGIVINMANLSGPGTMQVYPNGESPYVDVSGGELWINVLNECLKFGLAPKSWTDYLHLSVGGTLSNAGVGGQTFRHGPQISNVYQLQVVTGKGQVLNCSEEYNSDLFHSVLGGLGQFGVITRARIGLEPAPKMVKWIRVLYSNFSAFSRDQEYLITANRTFDYIEGFAIVNETNVVKDLSSRFTAKYPYQAQSFASEGKVLFSLDVAKYFNEDNAKEMSQEAESILSQLNYIPETLFTLDVPYTAFLDRVHAAELILRPLGLWDVPHPWLNLIIPASKIQTFVERVFGNILNATSDCPVLIYPVNKSKWDNRTSYVLPDEDIFYLVSFLFRAVPPSAANDEILIHKRVLDFCDAKRLGIKVYMAHYTTTSQWKAHFGSRWPILVQRKRTYDPAAILAPGQRIFRNNL